MNLITTTRAAAELGITRRRINALIKSGRLPAQRFGRDWMIHPQDIALVKERKPGYPAGKPRK